MTYTLKDLYTDKVIGTYGTKAAAEKAMGNSVQEPGESRYEIVSPKKSKPKVAQTRIDASGSKTPYTVASYTVA